MNTPIPSTIHGQINDMTKALWNAVTCGLPDYLFTAEVITLLWNEEHIEVERSYNTEEGMHFVYRATESGRIAFSKKG